MSPYLLKRRLRHIKSIRLSNIAFRTENFPPSQFQFLSCFITLETHKGQLLYVSEVQQASLHAIQFNEFPSQDNPSTSFILKIVIGGPDNIVASACDMNCGGDEQVWIVYRKFVIDMSKLRRIDQDDIVKSNNVPIFEILDGLYVMPNVPTVSIVSNTSLHRRTPSNYKVKNSFSFNAVLKLTMIVEYMRQVKDESAYTSHRLDKLMRCAHKEVGWNIRTIKNSNDNLRSIIERKKESQKDMIDNFRSAKQARQSSLVSQNPSLNDYYGNTYSDFIQSKNRLEAIRKKKVTQLVSILQNTVLFSTEVRFVELEGSSSSSIYNRLKLKLLNKERIFAMASKSETAKNYTNTSLGYYLFLVVLMAEEIFEIPLPYSLHFYGSTSIVEINHPLYLEESIASKNTENFAKAVDYFNKDIIQVIQHLELRRIS